MARVYGGLRGGKLPPPVSMASTQRRASRRWPSTARLLEMLARLQEGRPAGVVPQSEEASL